MYKLPPERLNQYFTCSRALYRILASGKFKEVSTVSGNKLFAMVNGERLAAVDIAWALRYGNWPKFRLAQLDGDPFNCSLDNLMPVRTKALRYVQRQHDGLYYHNLSEHGFPTPQLCRRDWATYARDHYFKDLGYVLALEADERALRQSSGYTPAPAPARVARRVSAGRKPRGDRGARPAPVEGHEWHSWEGEWVSVPVAVHVSDDYMQRIRAWRAGAVRAQFQPDYQETWYYRADGSVVHATS